MQRLVTLKLLSKAPRSLGTTTTSAPSKASLFLSNANPPHYPGQFTHYATFSHSKNGPLPRQWYFSRGFFLNPVLAKQFLSRTFPKGLSTGVSGGSFGSLKALFTRRRFHSLDSHGGGWRSASQRLTSDGVVLALVLSNVAVFMLWRVADRVFMFKNFTISADNFKTGRIHTLITHAFSHINVAHLISNMIGLYFFGTSIGRNFGPTYLLKLYLSGAIVGGVFHMVYHALVAPSVKGWSAPALGASGAVNAIMLLDIFLFPRNTVYLEFVIPVPAFMLGILIIGIDMFRIYQGDSKISGASHLGGTTVAAVAWALARRRLF